MASAACAQFTAAGSCRQAPACGRRPAKLVLQAGMGPRSRRGASSRTQQQLRQQQQQPRPCQRARAAAAEGAAPGGVPPGWEKANRVSADALAMLTTGETNMAELILKKGLKELGEEHPGDPSMALLHTQLWNLQQEGGQYAEALEQAQQAYDLMVAYFGEESADAAFHGIRVGISLVVTNGDIDRAQELLVYGGSCAQHNLEIFWNKLQEMEAAGEQPDAMADLALSTKKLMVSLAECNFYGAIGIVRKALQSADDLELPMSDLEEAWLGGTKQMLMALPPDHPMFEVSLRELGRLIPDAAGRPQLQEELEGVQQKLKELLYLIKQMPDSMKQQLDAEGQPGGAAAAGEEFLP